jgi:hypothetical protein
VDGRGFEQVELVNYGIGLAAFAERRPPEFPPLTARRVT